jgi:NAD(P)H-hydrate epimerase
MNTSSDLPIRPFGRALVGAPTGQESTDFDRFSIDELGVPQTTLMENAGRSAALVLQRLFPRGQVTALAGTGNNGGDALVLLRNLAAWGRPVTAVLVGDQTADEGLLHGWGIRVLQDTDFRGEGGLLDGELAQAEVIVDGVLGTGISGPPRKRQAWAIHGMNRADAPVLALDIPSGADAVNGSVPGDCVKADVTVAFGGAKLGSLLHPARAFTGRLVVVEIGFPPLEPETFRGTLITPEWVTRRVPRRDPDTHKNAVGALLLVAGRAGMAGAAVLAARAALRAGAGFVRVSSPPENRSILQQAVPESVYVDSSDARSLEQAILASRALGVGPGMGTEDEGASLLERILATGGPLPLLVDADALNLIAAGRAPSLKEIGEGRDTVLTPHPGEMSRLTGLDSATITGNRPEAALKLAGET